MNLSKKELERLLSLGKQAVRLASQHLLDHWEHCNIVEQKESYHSIVSEEDIQSEKILIESLEKAMPGHSFISEERGQIIQNDELTWVIDPLDGSSYYIRGLRSFSVSVALLYQWQPILGIVACPSNAELFTALRAGGSYLNSKPITVSSSQKPRDCIFSFSHRFLREPKYSSPREELVPLCRSIRGGGSCAQELCYIACGRIDGFVAPAQKFWDFAAGAIIVEEAGGKFTNFYGESPDYSTLVRTNFSVVASNGHVHSRILEPLSSCPRE